jgi:YgiT-type zinc finger domain-containing protein
MADRNEGNAGPAAGTPAAGPDGENMQCLACQSGKLNAAEVKTAIWHGSKLVVVEDVPAYVCDQCGEQYYRDETAIVLDMMRGDGFDPAEASRKMDVPVFGFRALGTALGPQVRKRLNEAEKNGADVAGTI